MIVWTEGDEAGGRRKWRKSWESWAAVKVDCEKEGGSWDEKWVGGGGGSEGGSGSESDAGEEDVEVWWKAVKVVVLMLLEYGWTEGGTKRVEGMYIQNSEIVSFKMVSIDERN